MSINKESASKLFKIPSTQREDPFVHRIEIQDKPSDIKSDKASQYDSYVAQMNYLAYGFDNIVIEYDMLIDVLIKRAKMRNVKLQVSDIAKNNISFANHLSVLYGTQIKEIDFASYVKLLKYEQVLASSHTTQLINVNNPSLPDIQDTESIIAKPESAAITAIKKEYVKYLSDNNFLDLLFVDALVYNSHNAASNKAVVQKLSETTDGQNILGQDTPIDIDNKASKLIKDCFPCLERSLLLLGEWPKTKLWDYFLNEFWKGFIAQLQQLAKMKLALTNIGFGSAICTLINMLTKNICLPDLASLLAFVKMMIARVKNAFVDKFSLSAGTAINDLISLIITPVLDAIIMLLIKAINSVLSPIDCVITSINHEMDKIFPPELYPVFGFQSSDIELSSPRNEVEQLITDMQTEKQLLETKILTFINEKTKNWELKVFDEDEALGLYTNFDKYMTFASMIYEIIDLVKTFNVAVAETAFNTKTKQDAFQQICTHSINRGKPWLFYDNSGGDDGLDDVGNGGSDNTGGGSGGGNTGTGGGSDDTGGGGGGGDTGGDDTGDGDDTGGGTGGGTKGKDKIKIIDTSLPPDFFDGDDIITVLEDDSIKDIINGLTYNDDIQDGKDPLSIDKNLINRYKAAKNKFKSTTFKDLNSTESEQSFFVVGTIDFAECLALNNLQGKTKEQVQNWINKITG